MPVKKYRDVSEMEGNTWCESGDPRLFAAIRATWELADRTLGARRPTGVYKHRSVEEAAALREEWEQAAFEAFRKGRRQASRRKPD